VSAPKCEIEHIDLSPGSIITVKGLTAGEFQEMVHTIQRKWEQEKINRGTIFIQLPRLGALNAVTWEDLQRWQEERIKDD
jgi:hypothetical protein